MLAPRGKLRRKLVEILLRVRSGQLLAQRQRLRHEGGAAVPHGGELGAVRARQVIMRGEILPEPRGEDLHAGGVEVVGVDKIRAAVKTDGVKRVVQVEQVVAVFAHDGGHVVKDAGVGRLRAVRRAQKERLHAETLRLRAERAQILFVRRAERQRPDIRHIVRGQGLAHRLHALGQRAAGLIHDVQTPLHRHPFPHLIPVGVVLGDVEVKRGLQLSRHTGADGLEPVARPGDVVDPLAEVGLQRFRVLVIDEAVDVHDDQLRVLAVHRFCEQGAVEPCRDVRDRQRIARVAVLLPRERGAVAGVELARADEHHVEAVLRLEEEAVHVALVPVVIRDEHRGDEPDAQHGDEHENDRAHRCAGFGDRSFCHSLKLHIHEFGCLHAGAVNAHEHDGKDAGEQHGPAQGETLLVEDLADGALRALLNDGGGEDDERAEQQYAPIIPR